MAPDIWLNAKKLFIAFLTMQLASILSNKSKRLVSSVSEKSQIHHFISIIHLKKKAKNAAENTGDTMLTLCFMCSFENKIKQNYKILSYYYLLRWHYYS